MFAGEFSIFAAMGTGKRTKIHDNLVGVTARQADGREEASGMMFWKTALQILRPKVVGEARGRQS